ncbi:uncharacterized protein LOC129569153 [Sitodiplosis mosellana]|uniref:uncharacterized protein LOC129569153 n=1 Tax=Sitodiplosis mosellana TaxID=263140 RepID=UPI002443E5A3|nr:uncharacterized protein LOC129569153 [Sitodiplosis mosellana]
MKMEESTEIKTETPMRRSIRAKVPNTDLINRRKILSKIPVPPSINRNYKMKRQSNIKKMKGKVDLQIKNEPDDSIGCEQSNKTIVQPDEIPIKEEKDEVHDENDSIIKPDPLIVPDNFIVTKNARIMCGMDKAIEPVYFPTEAQNSGLILFNSSSKKAILKISYPKCFVILSGQFHVDGQGVFQTGDFIKAPAGSQLGIKYQGGSEGCGRIIFFKSQS